MIMLTMMLIVVMPLLMMLLHDDDDVVCGAVNDCYMIKHVLLSDIRSSSGQL